MDSINSLNAQQAQQAAWELYLQQQAALQKLDQAVGDAGNPQFNSGSDSNSTGPSTSF